VGEIVLEKAVEPFKGTTKCMAAMGAAEGPSRI
jgi:hypothetical protein